MSDHTISESMPLLPWLRAEVLTGSAWSTWMTTHFAVLDTVPFALLGFCIEAGGIVPHVFRDVITISGIQPLLPFSQRTVSVSPLRAANPLVNNGLWVLGVVAIIAVEVMKAPLEAGVCNVEQVIDI